jgi:cell division protein FtsL
MLVGAAAAVNLLLLILLCLRAALSLFRTFPARALLVQSG